MLAEHAYQLVSAALQVEDFDDSTLVTYQDGFHIQFGFSAMHPLARHVPCTVNGAACGGATGYDQRPKPQHRAWQPFH